MYRLILLLIIMLIGFMLTVNSSANTIVTDDLVSYWTFDRITIKGNTVEDIWGENDATIVGNPISTNGYLKEGLELDGNGDYVILPNVGNFGSRTGAYTFEVWFNTTYKENMSAIYKVVELPCVEDISGYGILINTGLEFDRPKLEFGRPKGARVVPKEDFMLFSRSEIKGKNTCASSATSIHRPVSDGKWHHIVYTTREPTEEEVKEIKRKFGRTLEGNCLVPMLYIDNEQVSKSYPCTLPIRSLRYTTPIYLGAVNNMGEASAFFNGTHSEYELNIVESHS